MAKAIPAREILELSDAAAWEAWLGRHHDRHAGVWLKLPRKPPKARADDARFTYAQALEAALCYGWIDGQKCALDEKAWLRVATAIRPETRARRIATLIALLERGEKLHG